MNEDKKKDRSGSDRRSNIDRRRTIAPWKGEDYRKLNRRKADDRRGLPHGVFYETDDSLDALYEWLGGRCRGKWSAGLEQADKSQAKKSVKVLFELESDKNSFMQELGGN